MIIFLRRVRKILPKIYVLLKGLACVSGNQVFLLERVKPCPHCRRNAFTRVGSGLLAGTVYPQAYCRCGS